MCRPSSRRWLRPRRYGSVVSRLHDASVSDYWATIAEVIPVIAFAIVLEARAITLSWRESKVPRAVRAIQSLFWGSILIVFAFTETSALQAVRGTEPPAWLPVLTEFAISGGMGILVLSPAIEVMVRANPEGTARILTVYPIARARLWYLDRRVLRSIRWIDWMLTQSWADFALIRDAITESESRIAEMERELLNSEGRFAPDVHAAWEERVADVRGRVARGKARWDQSREQLRERFAEHEKDKAAYLSKRAQRPAQLREGLLKERKVLAARFAAFSLSAPIPPPPNELSVGMKEIEESAARQEARPEATS